MKKIFAAVPLLGIGLSMPSMTLGSEIEPGFDLFETEEGAEVDLGCAGQIQLEGNPALLSSAGLGNTDTIVSRQAGISFFPDTIEIEVVALSLKSIDPFDGSCLGVPSLVDLYVTINANGVLPVEDLPQPDALPPSTGSMTIDHQNLDPDGGHFTSNLSVYADLIFVKAAGDISNQDDWLANMPAPDVVNLNTDAWWTHTPQPGDKHNSNFPAGKFYIVIGNSEKPFKHTGPHPVKPNLITLDSFTTTIENGAVSLEWATGTEKNNAKFAVWRAQPVNGQCSDNQDNYTDVQKLGSSVASKGTEVSGATYTMTDSGAVSGNTYCYALEDIDYDGKSTFHVKNIVSATP